MSSARIFARNLSANWFSFGANLVVMFFLSPFVVHTLGETAYGIWSLLMVVTGYMGMFDMGVRASTGRYIILYLGRDDHHRVDETVRTSLLLFSMLGLVLLAVGFALGWGFPYFFQSTPEEYHRLVAFLLPALAVNLWLAVIGAVFSSVLTAHDRFDLARSVDLGVLAVRAVGTVLVLSWGYGIVGLTIVTLICGVLALVGNYLLARKTYERLRVWPLQLVRPRLRELFGYGIWAAIATNAYRLMGQTDLVIVGILLGVSRVTVYSVGAMLIYYSDGILSKIYSTAFPPLQRAVARGDMASVRWYYVRQLRLALALGIPMFLGYVIYGRLFISLWMGDPAEFPERSVEGAALVMSILSVGKILYLPAFGGEPLLATVDRVRFVAITAVVEAITNLGLSIFFVLVMRWGIAGVAAGTLVARVLVRGWVIPWQALPEAGVRVRDYLRVITLGLAAGVWFALWSLLVRTLFPEQSWPMFSGQVALSLAGYAPVVFLLLVPARDRRRMYAAVGLGETSGG